MSRYYHSPDTLSSKKNLVEHIGQEAGMTPRGMWMQREINPTAVLGNRSLVAQPLIGHFCDLAILVFIYYNRSNIFY